MSDQTPNPNTAPITAGGISSAVGTSPRERRRFMRTREDRPAWLHRGSASTSVEMVDISRGGACFISPRPLTMGREVRLQVGHGGQQLTLDGKIVRHLERPDGRFEVGICIDDAPAFDANARYQGRAARVVQS